MDKRKIIYYRDELNDEFSKAQITPTRIDGKYVYCHDGVLKKCASFFLYRLVFFPIAYAYSKFCFGHKLVGKEKLDEIKDKGYFLYGNHTQDIADAFLPNLMSFPKRSYFIVHPNNVSIPFLSKLTPLLGALPLPDDLDASRNFLTALKRRVEEGNCIVIYPEAHIWPYYTKIRPFKDDAFYYPVKLGAPVFCFTNTYQKRRFRKRPRIVTYIDGPFYPDEALPKRQQKGELRNRIHDCMCERAKLSDVEVIKYIREDEEA